MTSSGNHLVSTARRDPAGYPAPIGKPRPGVAGPRTWSAFWQEFGLEHETTERCYIPGDGRHVVDRHWTHFANSLPLGAQVVDLGCGAGVAGRALLGIRSDLHVTGVDWADVPIPRLANLTIHPGVNMEALPFRGACFDAAISLFGIEYGNIDKTARELGRVLKAGAQFSFLVHHSESEILREGAARRRALQELLAGRMKAAFLAGSAADIDRHRQRLKEKFPGEPMVNLVSDYFRRNSTHAGAQRRAMWQKLAADLDPEILLLIHLERSAKSAVEMGSWLNALLPVMAWISVSALRRSSGEPIAWKVDGAR